MSRIVVVATGGTIQNTRSGRIAVQEVLAHIRSDADAAWLGPIDLEVDEVLRSGAEEFGLPEWRTIVRAVVANQARSDVDGVVVTHGTFTAEETAWLLHLVTPGHKPVVMAVAQRKSDLLGSDAARNLLDAIRVALYPEASGRGVLLVAAEEIHGARDVVKLHRRPSGFDSGPNGLLGTVDVDRVAFSRRVERRHTAMSGLTSDDLEAFPRVDVVAVHSGADGVAIDALVAAGSRAIVTSGFAYSGVATPAQTEALTRAADQGVAIVLATRGRGGRVPVTTTGSLFTTADGLPAQKARILAGLALAHGATPDALQGWFDEY